MVLKKTIYFAGPDVFRQNPEHWFDACAIYAERFGLEAIFPIDNDQKNKSNDSESIYNINLLKIDLCTHVIANLQPYRGVSTDAGTCFEIGYARAKNKIVYGYYNGWFPQPYQQRVMRYREIMKSHLLSFDDDNTYPQIENFYLYDNLMIAHGCDMIFTSMEEAVRAVVLNNTAREL